MSDADDTLEADRPLGAGLRHVLQIAWPSFLMAGALEAIVFSMVDPQCLHGWAGVPVQWPAQAVYTAGFFIFWAVIATSARLSIVLSSRDP